MKLYCIILIFLCFSCSETIVNRNELKEQLIPTYELIEDGEKTFILDSESQPRNRCIQLFRNPQNDSTYYSFYNEYNNSIYIFDFESTSFIKKIQLQKEGPDGVYPHRSGYYISSFDSIYFYSMATQRVYILNSQGKKYHTIDLRFNMDSEKIPPTIKVEADSPMYKIGNNLYLCGGINEEFADADSINHLIITKINVCKDDATPELFVGYPESYRQGNWGEAYFRNTFWCYNKKEKLFLISFPNDHYIYKTDLTKVTKIYAGSMYANSISSIDYSKSIPTPKKKRIAHYLSSYYYRAIIYDKYKNIYYRIIEHPWINYNPNERPWKKPLSIIIYDSNFQFLGETKLAEEYNLSANNFIITKEGLLIRKETNNEDEIKYTVFKLKEK